MKGFAVLLGLEVDLGGHLEIEAFLLDTFFLELAQFGLIFLALAAEAAMLKMQIADLLFEDNEGMSFDQEFSHAGCFAGKHLGKLDVAESEDAVLESRDAIDAPVGIGQRLDERLFAFATGLPFFEVLSNVMAVGFGVVAGEQHGAAGESSLDSVEARCLRARPMKKVVARMQIEVPLASVKEGDSVTVASGSMFDSTDSTTGAAAVGFSWALRASLTRFRSSARRSARVDMMRNLRMV